MKKMYRLLCMLVCLLVLAAAIAGCSAGNSAESSHVADSAAAVEQNSLTSTSMDRGAVKSDREAPMAGSSGQEDGFAASEAAAPAEKGVVPAGSSMGAVDGSTEGNTAAGGFAGGDLAAGLNKKLIYHANLNMEVESYEKAQSDVRNRVNLAGGYIIGFTETVSDAEQGGTFVLKVPAAGFSSFLDSLDKIKHKSIQRNIEGQDVSEEYVDLEARLKAKQLLESHYVEFMKKATKASDLVSFASELSQVQEEIEQIKGRMRYIDQNVLYSTVELRLYEPGEDAQNLQKHEDEPLLGRAGDALRGTLNTLSSMFQWVFIVLAGALPLLVAAVIILAFFLWWRRSRLRKGGESRRESGSYRNAASGGTGIVIQTNQEPVSTNKSGEEETDGESPDNK
ncbi:DUF4349 domain-containing protein [Paenibacillus sp. HN-1]|uniref:DUF4349 domain-containing protein n=1 Tax=Paenibacillus TaxID=44249 RepID=UPI001CA93149|nr:MULTISPECIES: DUF4349 domain-containing protein [Paenibacillus]MBY9081430.1 DUF4349 domain-containing protein [Paenibacillus sp. CGMCC 1.18879]MBY9084950.1 DUF4349 domain-containing protein [Paenibacillus sinensis]